MKNMVGPLGVKGLVHEIIVKFLILCIDELEMLLLTKVTWKYHMQICIAMREFYNFIMLDAKSEYCNSLFGT